MNTMENWVPKQLSGEAQAQFLLGMGLILSGWDSLQLVLQKRGSRDALQKVEQFPQQILSFFNQTREPVYIDVVYNILDDFTESFETVIEDGTLEETAVNIMCLHEECLEGNYTSIERMKEAGPAKVSVAHIRKGVDSDSDSESESDTDESVEMMIVEEEGLVNDGQNEMVVDEPMAAAEDGWTVVGSKKKRGPRNRI